MRRNFIKTGAKQLVAISQIVSVDYSAIHTLTLRIVDSNGVHHKIEGLDAIEAALVLNPACLEGERLRWKKGSWAFHNMVGHPLMQILAWLGKPQLGLWIHDISVPQPTGSKNSQPEDVSKPERPKVGFVVCPKSMREKIDALAKRMGLNYHIISTGGNAALPWVWTSVHELIRLKNYAHVLIVLDTTVDAGWVRQELQRKQFNEQEVSILQMS